MGFGENQNTNFALGVGGHYFVANNFGVGANLGFAYSKNGFSNWVLVVGPSVRYYVLGLVRVGAGVNLLVPHNGDLQANLPLSVGYPIFIKPNVAIEPNVNFNFGLTDGVQGWNGIFGLNFDFYFGDN